MSTSMMMVNKVNELRYPSQSSAFLALPYEVLLEILVLLGAEDVHSLLATSTTCRQLHALLYDDQRVWRGLALAVYDDPAHACAFLQPQEVDWQARVLSRAIATEILMDSRNVLGETSSRQLDLLLLKREEFAFLALNGRGTAYAVLDILRRVLDGDMWDGEAAVEAESPFIKLWRLSPVDMTCDSNGLVDWSTISAMVSILLWQYASEEAQVDVERIERSISAPLVGVGLGSGEDWAGVSGDWYAVAQFFSEWRSDVPLAELGTWTVSPCSLEDTLDGFSAFMGRLPTAQEATVLDPIVPFSTACAPIYFSGSNHTLPHTDGTPVNVHIRGVVRLSVDYPPAAVWTWVIERPDNQVIARVVQMPGRGSGFFGRLVMVGMVGTLNPVEFDEIEGAVWMMRT
ncbi:uncharacterized protein CcaverHIS019_0702910 [Cutaneotrichosporon cavernicola]|uniref:F-box domain-containing protein n=1 Tax=Cutaneotrichosporon cavernicola TaxID=279322 RepID=A0AA48QYW8_9TREE|nr:uncharacterized protein CcaverHIS019_0702910 [Cutaneotrichosporon cavernicola]BEI94710.1 hypothetical protein CcaverHIS019_0702910 [Cutaneotrichosporon cavernicola]BEJ02485.1 hypothetical protein CcaverHIS631_0702800 [Cutaneotrichosporon cavernicola]BEJ10243.1 hypothetical protein CcaverHIS641_0702780 [Cutaneotrichosporon cavernicola]